MRIFLLFTFLLLNNLAEGQNPGDNIFNSGQLIHEVRITFPFADWHDTLMEYHTIGDALDSNIYVMGMLEFDGEVLDSVGFKYKGNSSYNNPSVKKSWKISTEEFVSSNEVDDLNEFNLNNGFKDPSMLREKLMLDFFRHYNLPAPRCDFANVYVNDELWGFYSLIEEVDKKFLQSHFGNDSGNLYKGDPHGDLRCLGNNIDPYTDNYEKKTNETETTGADLLWMIDNLNNSTAEDFVDSLNSSFNTEAYMKSWVTSIMFSQFDSYTGSGHNYFIYHNQDSNQFEWINWDVNEAFGSFTVGGQIDDMLTVPIDYIPAPATNRPLHNKMKEEDVYWDAYRSFMCNALSNYFNPGFMFPIIDSLYTAIQQDVYAAPNSLFPDNQFDQNMDESVNNLLGLKPFIEQRYEFLMSELEGLECTTISSIVTAQEMVAEVFPIPAYDFVQVKLPASLQSVQLLQILDSTGRAISPSDFSIVSNGCLFSVASLSSGIYFGELVLVDGSTATFKLVRE